jgi:hypothetical protein
MVKTLEVVRCEQPQLCHISQNNLRDCCQQFLPATPPSQSSQASAKSGTVHTIPSNDMATLYFSILEHFVKLNNLLSKRR